ncbi:hypothetical protein N7508_004426 [Penicillium antarcticum]|uniref:uncharacterized protein n=1 Tax=Penicillium antarcticum TaxID=416450 RepID=UPI00238A5D78|nr:uncharacterized protein N7508_004426 [Penicillium antarcticum]KAJ5309047.1 hypothetical protein N7508_004426 [Penicillium antarcticum]
MASIPEDFLRGLSPNATLHKIDFEHTTPTIFAYKNNFAAIIDNFMTDSECKDLLNLAEESTSTELPDSTLSPPKWERAMINAGNGKQIMSVDSRKSGRIIFHSPEIAQRLLDRLMPFLRQCEIHQVKDKPFVTGLGPAKRGEVYNITRLNEQLRFLRYEGGDYFRAHTDGCYVTPDGKEKSLYTIHLYLNGEGEQDMEVLQPYITEAEKKYYLFEEDGEIDLKEVGADEVEVGDGKTGFLSAEESLEKADTLLGGATSFTDGFKAKDSVRVFPKAGSILIFQQRNLMHSGDDVFRGVKYTMRSDVMYSS